ncbi:MAG: GntR family transcriptional regulator [Acidimicrobiales bacterium]|jgi:DNA-binding GntR family transcriptional regulator
MVTGDTTVAMDGIDGAMKPELLLADQAYMVVRDLLVTLQIAPGAVINEEVLGRSLGMGRTPVREALKRLVLEKLVVVYPRRGTFAAEVNVQDLGFTLDVRIPLEGLAATRAAQYADAADIEALEALLADLGTEKDSRALLDLDARFHRMVYHCARNPYLEATLSQYLNLSMRILYLVADRVPNLPGHLAEQREILEAIESHDPSHAEKVAVEHLAVFEREMNAVLLSHA